MLARKKLPCFPGWALLSLVGLGANPSLQAAIGDPIEGLNQYESHYFQDGRDKFTEVDSVKGTEPGAEGVGLGPRFNMVSCSGCHAHPAIGGSSPPVNPQYGLANRYGAQNKTPFFITQNGPVRVARFKFNPDGSRDGGVHNLYVITGREDAGNCNLTQPDFDQAARMNNIIFRIPTPLYGAGLIEAIPDSVILANKNANLPAKQAMKIAGHANHARVFNVAGNPNFSGNDGTVSKFGWKAQNKSLLIFAGEAYNVEQGVTNEVFPNERDGTPECALNGIPEDYTHYDAPNNASILSDVASFASYMRFLGPPEPKPFTTAAQNGQAIFSAVGCALCHTPSLTTGLSSSSALSNKTVNLYSDLLLHHMGPGLADNIIQGDAGPDEFRSAPLWGLGSRLFYLHDGRTSDLTAAIQAHASTNNKCTGKQQTTTDGIACESEANQVIAKFNQLSQKDKSDLIEFLQSL